MPHPADRSVLTALLDSWERNDTILLNLLAALPDGASDARATPTSPTVAEQFTHIRDVRTFFVRQTAPEFAEGLPEPFVQGTAQRDPDGIARALHASADAVRNAVEDRLKAGGDLTGPHVRYDHPVLLLQHMLWHEAYHAGQMMLALKLSGRPLTDAEAEPVIWGVWRHES